MGVVAGRIDPSVPAPDVKQLDLVHQDPGLVPSELVFEKSEDYQKFNVEWAVRDDEYIVHFFPKPETTEDFWLRRFPEHMSDVAMAHFQMTPPALQGAYTEELASWWMSAKGAATRLFAQEFIKAFFAKLNAACEAA